MIPGCIEFSDTPMPMHHRTSTMDGSAVDGPAADGPPVDGQGVDLIKALNNSKLDCSTPWPRDPVTAARKVEARKSSVSKVHCAFLNVTGLS